jgi:isocitrate dehydrogenase
MQRTNIAVAHGDGIGPEIMQAVLDIIQATGAPLDFEKVDMGKDVYLAGHSTGMTDEAKATIERLGILLKGPMETPKGAGMKSINVTARKLWNTYANKRTFCSLQGVDTVFSKAGIPIDITIVRENIEDTYGGIEHMLTPDVALCRRFITRPGSEQVIRYTFEMARQKGARRVTCGHKANIMKLTDGLFLETFYEIAKEYPDLKVDDIIVDDLAMKLVAKPEIFDVVVLTNLQGDIMSDLCAGLVGGLGFAPSANIGDHVSIFEAVHGSAPDIAGKGIANPTALLLSSLGMLRHLGLVRESKMIENALHQTLRDGYHTADFGGVEAKRQNTGEFAARIIERLAEVPGMSADTQPAALAPRKEPGAQMMVSATGTAEGDINGVDIFLESSEEPKPLGDALTAIVPDGLRLVTMSNRGTQVYPTGSKLTRCINQYRVRIEREESRAPLTQEEVLAVAGTFAKTYKLCSLEMLMVYNGKRAYSLAQGQ